MNFLKNIFGAKHKGFLSNAGKHGIKNLLCGIGESEIIENGIAISKYPFEPSVAYPEKTIPANEIDAICVEFGVCKIYVSKDIVFVSAEQKEKLVTFAEDNKIPLTKHNWNWDYILEPYLDTEFSEESQKKAIEHLAENGIEKGEVDALRAEVGKQMYKYNVDTMLWDWCSLSLPDVLSAMRATYTTEQFRDFYKRALEVEKRGNEQENIKTTE